MGKRINPGVTKKKDSKRSDNDITIDKHVAMQHGIVNGSSDKEHPYVSLKYYDYDYCCFSNLEKDELKNFTNLTRKFKMMTWSQVKGQGGKKQKSGLALTPIERKSLPQKGVLNEISEDVRFSEIRLSQKARIFGFRSHSTYFVVFIDRNHDEF